MEVRPSADVARLRQGLRLARELAESLLESAAGGAPYASWLARARELEASLPAAPGPALEGLKGAFLELDRAAIGIVRLLTEAVLAGRPVQDPDKRLEGLGRILSDLRLPLGDPAIDGLVALARRPASSEASAELHPAAALVEAVLTDAARRGASEIHVAPAPGAALVAYRLSGELRPILEFPADYLAVFATRLKIVAWLDIAERKRPQEGAILPGREGAEGLPRADVGTLPVLGGERLYVRLPPGPAPVEPPAIGLGARDLLRYRALCRGGGLLIHGGPRGSGRTTALLSSLQELADRGLSAYAALESEPAAAPPGVSITIARAGDTTYESLARLYGRRRADAFGLDGPSDGPSLEAALRQAAGGAVALVALHVPDAVAALRRLVEMGLPPDLIRLAVKGACGHRLVRRLCRDCRAPYDPTAEERAALGAAPAAGGELYRPVGCSRCQHTGYLGVVPVVELLAVDEPLRRALGPEAVDARWRELAVGGGMTPWRDILRERVLAGETSLAEAVAQGV
ncbi:MAG: Flp pilus assembly complex ATPase component TadA [Elusimicrobia bacterium]|nr:Flp pilus assembly complex ATPase component TadA [Elusimicrobiota bacterium]